MRIFLSMITRQYLINTINFRFRAHSVVCQLLIFKVIQSGEEVVLYW